MKENGINKLVELLNEREKKEINQTYEWHNLGEFVFADNLQTGQNMDSSESASILIAKNYGFIQRLIENDKIDSQKFREKAKFLILSNSIKYYEFLIMELSIQKKPINFLISILR